MGRVEDVVPTIEIDNNKGTETVQPQVKRFYQKDGTWYAVIQFVAGEAIASLHVALGAA